MTQDMVKAAPATSAEIYNRSLETFRGGEAVLLNSQTIASKAVAIGEQILALIANNGGKLTPELDKQCNDFIAKCNTRKKEMEDARKPITQIMDAVKKMFTEEESKIDVKGTYTVVFKIQQARNQYAQELAEQKRREAEEAQKKADRDREAVNIKGECEQRIQRHFNDYLFARKNELNAELGKLTLDNYDGRWASINALVPAYPYEHFNAFQHGLFGRYHSKEEIELIVRNVTTGKFEEFAERYKSEIIEVRDYVLSRFASRKTELEQMAQANEAERQRLEQLRINREREESERLKREQEEAQRQQELNIKANTAAEETMVLFEKEASLAPVADAPETREGFEITISHPAGYVQIFQLWFEHEGKTLTNDKIEKKSVAQMKAFCEKLAHKNNIKIESQFITYNPTYKAVNRKAD